MVKVYKNHRKLSLILKEIKIFLCFFVLIFLLLFVGLNFESLYGSFKYDFNRILPNEIRIIGEAAMVKSVSLNSLDKNEPAAPSQPDSVLIPKINVNAPIITPKSADRKDILIALKEGVALHPDSVLPGQKGTAVISGHSSPHLFYRGDYNTVFSLLNKLEKGDSITVYLSQKKYVYKVADKRIFYPSEKILSVEDKNKSTLILLSCWPVGTDWKRLAVEAELVN